MSEKVENQIRHDLYPPVSSLERLVLWLVMAIVSILVFGGFYQMLK